MGAKWNCMVASFVRHQMEVRNSPLDDLLTGTFGYKGGLVQQRYRTDNQREISLGGCLGKISYIVMSSNELGNNEKWRRKSKINARIWGRNIIDYIAIVWKVRGSETGGTKNFSSAYPSRLDVGPVRSLLKWVLGHILRVKKT
jgi:hypothetical protein